MSDKQLLKRLASLSPEQRELLLKQLQKKKSKTAQPKVDSIQPFPRQSNRLPMSYAQQRLWFLDQLQSGSASYNISAALRLEGNLDVEALRLSFEEIVSRHESLRTTFVTEEGQGRQVINESQRWELPTISLEPLSPDEQDEVLKTRFRGDAHTSFDLINGPLLRTRLIRLASDCHILFVTMHHIVADGWSMGVLIKEVAALYSAYLDDKPSPLADLKIQYPDYAQWQREYLKGERLDKQLSYWKERLQNVPILELPTDFSRPPQQTYEGANVQFVVSEELTSSLNALCKSQGVTLFMVLVATLQVLLHRYSSQDDICVGTPIANRIRPELESLIGCFVNTLAIRSEVTGNLTFTSLLKQVQQHLTAAYDHQDIPFERLVDELGVAREMSHTPLFQVMFVLQNAQANFLQLPGLNIELLPEESKTSKFDLTVNLREEKSCILGDWEYRTDLFREETIVRMMGHFNKLLESVVLNPNVAIDTLNLLNNSERDQLVHQWNRTTREYERDSTIAEMFESQVQATPDRTAVEFKEHALSYAELNQISNAVAYALLEKGIQPEQRVGLCADRSIEMVAGILGILKAGAAFVPLDPSYPQDRLHYMLEDSSADIALVHRHLRERLPIKDDAVIILDEFGSTASELLENPSAKTSATSPAYVMYTSGSTGKPKGIEVVQRNVLRLVRNTDFMTIDENIVFLQYAPISFDAATLELWAPLLNGGKLVVCPPGQLDAEALGNIIQKHQVNAAWLTAALFHFFAEYHIESLAGIRQLLAGGDVLSPTLVRKVLNRFSDITLINGYGPTENTTFTCCYPMHTIEDVRQTVPIGRPIANTKVYVLDKELNPVPLGVPGELYTSGDGVSNGYLNREELTREVFVSNPFDQGNDPVMYKTGDLVRYYPDGLIEYLGRIDQQVKIRGYRIELGEIEDAISNINTVREVAVIAREDVPGVKRLVGYFVPVEGENPTAGELKAELKQVLPEYMIPSAFVTMGSFPVTANGKLDRKALPRPEEEHATGAVERIAPRNPKEQALADIWKQVLNLEEIGVYDNFFELGGDSILSIQITSRAKLAGLHLTTKQIFENQSIAELAEVASEVETPILAEQGLVMGEVALSPIENWFFDHEFVDEHHWNQSVLLDLKPDVTLTNIHIGNALAAVVMQHDALRLRFKKTESGVVQFHEDETDGFAHFALHEIDLKRQTPKHISDELASHAEGVQSSLNLAKGPLLAAAIFELPDNSRKLLLTIHHLVVDGVSWRILLDDFTTALKDVVEKRQPKFAPKTTSYKQWVESLAEHTNNGGLDAEVDIWKASTQAVKPLIPVDNPDGDNSVAFQRIFTVALDEEKTASLLREVPKAYKTEINDVLLTALAKTMADWTGNANTLIDLEGHGREMFNERVDLSRTVGWFTSVYPVRLSYDAALPIDANVKSIKEYIRNIPNRGFGFGALKYLSNDDSLKQALAKAPKADIVFNYLGQFDSILENNPWFGLATDPKGSEHSLESKETHLLGVNSHVVSGKLHVDWIFSQSLFDEKTIEHLGKDYLKNLTKIVDYCLDPTTFGYTPSDFPLSGLDQVTIDKLFGSIPNIESVYPLAPMQEGMLFHSLFDTSSGVYFEQLSVDVIGDIDREKLHESWNRVINRHPVLRSAFLWQDLDRPLQVVYSNVEAEGNEFDWTGLTEEQEEHRFNLWLEQDRQRGFDFEKPGLTRLAWIDLPNQRSRLVWSFHHVVLDGWSLPLIMGEIFQTYTALAQGQQPQLAPSGKYEDFIGWLQKIDKADSLQFWKNYMHGFMAPTPLAGMKTNSSQKHSKQYHELELMLDVGTTSQLQQFARDQHITLNTVVQAGWGILLSRYSGEDDVVFGTTVSGRPADLPGVENIVGLFINTLPLRVHIGSETKIEPLLQSMQEEQLDLRRFEATPLVDIHHHSEVPGDQNLFDSILVFENYPVGEAVKAGDQLLDIGHVTSIEHTNYPLTLIVEPGDTLRLKLSYDASLFNRTTVERILTHLHMVFKGILEQPDVCVKQQALLSASEQKQALLEWNPAPAAYPRDLCIHQLFEAQVLKNPQQIAIQFGDQTLTYDALNKAANKLARILIAKGVRSESYVAIGLDRSIDMIVGIIAILKAGGAYVPLDPGYPEERLTFMLEDTKAPVLVTTSEYAEVLLPIAEKVGGELATILLDKDSRYIDEQFDTNLDQPIFGDAKRLAYVVYTSGSTGKPKGVVCHQLAVNRLVLDANYVDIQPQDKVAHLSNVSFDASTFEIWGALLNGATLVGISKDLLLTPEEFVNECYRTHINVMFITTALFNVFAINYPELFGTLKYLLFGGEACDPQQVRKIVRDHKPSHFLHVYGPSENTTYSTWYEITEVEDRALTVPIGRSLSGSTAYILDKHMQPVPVGVNGEIYVGGDGLANGYLNDPEKTAAAFISNPFGDDRLYKTGDLARFTEDGQIEILGRADDQVKIRGFRIELGEVEASLTRVDSVIEAVVLVKEDGPGQKRLVAYIMGKDLDAAEVRREAAKLLPKHMMPAAFVVMDEFPLTQNGKINKRALPEPTAEATIQQEYVPARNERESILVSIWEQVLKADTIGVYDNFFELGGDSILSIQIISRAKRAGLHLTAKQIFEYQTVADLAEVATDLNTLIKADQGLIEGEALITPIQQWFFDQQIADHHHYNQSVVLSVDERLDTHQLQEAWEGVLAQHDALRLLFHCDKGGKWHQTFRRSEHIESLLDHVFESVNLSSLDAKSQSVQIETLATQFQQEINLEKGPLIKVVNFKLGEGQRSRLLVVIHHLVVDVFSWRILVEDLQTALNQMLAGKAVDLGSKTSSFQQWGEALSEFTNSGNLGDDYDYWKSLVEIPVTDLVTDNQGKNTVSSVNVLEYELDKSLTKALLTETSSCYHTEINELLLTALSLSIAEWTQHPNVLVDMEGHGREHISDSIDVSRTVGWFTSIFPVVLQLPKSDDLGLKIKSIKEQMRQIPLKGMSFGLLKHLSNDPDIRSRIAGAPQAQISFNYLGQLDQIVEQESLIYQAEESSGEEVAGAGERKYLLEVNGRVQQGVLKLGWRYSSAIHHEKTIKSLAESFVTNLKAVIEHCADRQNGGYTPSDFPLAKLSQEKLDQIVPVKTGIEAVYPLSPVQEGMLFHSLYEPNSWVYFDQVSVDLGGDVNVDAMFDAWRKVVQRHQILRTGFVWEGLEKPLQVVHEKIELPIAHFDWSNVTEEEAKAKLARYMVDDRNLGFNFRQPGILRFSWIKMPNERFQLIWSFHHILLDGWSMPVVFQELFAAYEGLIGNEAPELPRAPKYQSFIDWMSSRDQAESDAFWTNYLQGLGAPTPIPVKNAPAVVHKKSLEGDSAARYAEEEIAVAGECLSSLTAIAKQSRLTLNHILQGVWAILLGRYSGETDILFGTTVSGRPADLAGVEHMVGCFINTIPKRMVVDGAAHFMDWLQTIQDQQVDLKRFESSSLVDIQKCSEISSKELFFESILVFENYPIDDSLEDSQASLDIGEIDAFQQTNFPLTLIAIPGKEMVIRFSFDSHLFELSVIQRMLGHIQQMLESIAREQHILIDELPIISANEFKQLTHEWNQTTRALPNLTMAAQFEQNADQYGSSIACEFAGKQTTYSELNANANRLAHFLLEQGVKPGNYVALSYGRSEDMLTGMLAALKIGAAYVPVDPNYPQDRIHYMLENSGAEVLLSHGDSISVFDFLLKSTDVCVADTSVLDKSKYSADNLNLAPLEGIQSDACIIYTSGSTGKPKGVRIPQVGITRLVVNTNYMVLGNGHRIGHTSNVSFDAASFEIWGALLNGATLVGVDQDTLLDVERLEAFLNKVRLSHFFVTTALFNVLARHNPQAFGQFDYVFFGGEACDARQIKAVLESGLPPKHLIHAYGPCENSTYSTCYEVTEVLDGAATVPVGRAVSNSALYLLDQNRRPVPVGVAGEIYVGGIGVANGYLNRPDLTETVFMEDPFSDLPNPRMYKTGDLGRLLETGELEIVGRIDDQVKIRGFRIELGEIESALSSVAGVLDCIVTVLENEPGQKQLVAYCETEKNSAIEVSELRAKVKQLVPHYMVPSAFVLMGPLPLTPNGKVDKRALPTPQAADYVTATFVGARNATEEALTDVWKDVLGLSELGIFDDFFELGGHSLLITKVSSRIKEKLNVELPLRTLFEVPTIAALAEIIGAVLWQKEPAEADAEEAWDDEEFEEGTL